MTLYGAGDFRRVLRGRATITPTFVDPAAVEIHGSAKHRIGRRHQERNASPHAETDDSQSSGISDAASTEKVHRSVYIVEDFGISTIGSAFVVVGVNFRRVSMIKIRSHTDVTRLSDPPRHLLRKVGNTILILNDDDRRKRTPPVGLNHVEVHRAIIDGDCFPRSVHDSPPVDMHDCCLSSFIALGLWLSTA